MLETMKMNCLNETSLSFEVERIIPSLCPVCLKPIDARLYQDGRKVLMEKWCSLHGHFRDLYFSDAGIYRKFMLFNARGSSMESPIAKVEGCPSHCGLCENHKTGTVLGNIDITARCNLSCPICFADAGDSQTEPTQEQIRFVMTILRQQKPVPCPAVQLSGGEPTMREDLPEIVAMAKKLGFAQIQVATNGLMLATSRDLSKTLAQNGLSSVYLQFDGFSPETHKALRGRDLLHVKLQAIENVRNAGHISVILVPTLARNVNDDQVGKIIRFASMNADTVKGVNFQPISFVGRIDQKDRAEMRLTISDLLTLVEEQTDNEITRDDFYPVPFVSPISGLISAETGSPQPTLTVHPCCGAATYVHCFKGQLTPITRFMDVEGLMNKIEEEVERFDGSRLGKLWMKGMILKELPKFIDEARIPRGLAFKRLFLNILRNGTRQSLIDFHNNMLFIGTMFFQDLYNMDLNRLQRCGVHYALPDGRIIPFCSYNTIYRSRHSDQMSDIRQDAL